MTRKAGISFLDVMIILGIVLLLAALAIPRFVKVPDYGNEEDDVANRPADTNSTAAATNASPSAGGTSVTTNSAADQPGE